MSKVKLKIGLRFKLNEKIYIISSLLHDGNIKVIGETFNEELIYTQSYLIQELNAGNLVFETYSKNSKLTNYETVFGLSIYEPEFDKYRDEAIFKYNVIKPLIFNENKKRIKQDVIDRVSEINSLQNNPLLLSEILDTNYFKKVSISNVYKWIKNFQESNRDVFSLIPRYANCGGKGKHRLNSTVIQIIQDETSSYYLTPIRPSITDLLEKVEKRIDDFNEFSYEKLDKPSYDTIERYIMSTPEYEISKNRIGKRTADNKFDSVNEGVRVDYPFERVEIDGTPLDLIVVNENGEVIGKPTFILAIDKFTRYPAGFSLSFGEEGWQDVMLCMRHILMDKSYVKEKYPNIKNQWLAFGIPETIVIDNGLGFKNKAMMDACYQLGINLQFCPPRVPRWKGSIERFFRTSATRVIHKLPGTTRSNRLQLGDNENPSKNASITLSNLVKLLHVWIIDKYSQETHGGSCEKPAILWQDEVQQHPVPWPSDIKETIILLGKVEYRQLSRRGISLMWLHYNSNELNKLLKRIQSKDIENNLNLKIKYDPYDLHNIYVFDHLIDKKWIQVSSVYPEYTNGLTEWEHKLACKRLYDKAGTVTIEGLMRENKKIRKSLDEGREFSERQVAKVKQYNSSTIISQQCDSIYSNDNVNSNLVNSVSDIGTIYSDDTNKVMSTEKSYENINSKQKNNSKKKLTNTESKSSDSTIEDDISFDESKEYTSILL